jgi:hypothetical protein
MSKGEYWDDYSEDSEYNRERRGDPKKIKWIPIAFHLYVKHEGVRR